MDIFRRTFQIVSRDTDPGNRARADAIAGYMMEAAGLHADAWGLAVQGLQEENRTWVLARLGLRLYDRPGWKEEITVETWSRGFRGFQAVRDFLVRGPGETIVARGSSVWFVLDLATRKPMRLDPYAGRAPSLPDRTAGIPEPGKIPSVPAWERETPIQVRSTDLDLNGHVNNVCYLAWIYEGVPPETLETSRISEAVVHYTAETFYPETVVSRSARDPDPQESGSGYIHSMIRASDGAEVVKARTVWTPL